MKWQQYPSASISAEGKSSEYISMLNVMPFLPCALSANEHKPENAVNERTDGQTGGWMERQTGGLRDIPMLPQLGTGQDVVRNENWKNVFKKVSLLDTVILTLTYDLEKLIRSGHCDYQCFKFEKNKSRGFWVIALTWLQWAEDAASTWNHNIRRSFGYGGYNWQTREIWSKVINYLQIFNIIFSILLFLPEPSYWTRDAMITSLLRQNSIATSFQRNDKVIIAPCVQWDVGAWGTHGWYWKSNEPVNGQIITITSTLFLEWIKSCSFFFT